RRLDLGLGRDAAAFGVVNRTQFLRRGAVHARAARLDFTRVFRQFLLILLRPGFDPLKQFFRDRRHVDSLAYSAATGRRVERVTATARRSSGPAAPRRRGPWP